MAIADTLLAEFDRETSITRKLIERIPPNALDWKPHARSTTMGGLARHLAHLIAWAKVALPTSTFDIAERQPMSPTATLGDILSIYDGNAAAVRSLIAGRTDDELNAMWTLTGSGRQLMTLSKSDVVSSMV